MNENIEIIRILLFDKHYGKKINSSIMERVYSSIIKLQQWEINQR